MIRIFCLSALLLLSLHARAEIKVLNIGSEVANKKAQRAHTDHVVMFDDKVEGNGLLLISISGTGSPASAFDKIDRVATTLGYHVLGIDYPNAVISTACRDSKTINCFDKFRREIVLGEPVSDLVKIDKANSIEDRIESLMAHLSKTDPKRWQKFLKGKKIDWSKVVVIGHSQGAGHAAFLAKLHPLKRTVLFAGPQDSSKEGVANWIKGPSATAGKNYFAFLHKKDTFDSGLQIQVNRTLIGDPKATVASVDLEPPKSGDKSQILVTDAKVGDPHNSLIQPPFEKIWLYLLKIQEQPVPSI